MIGRISRVWRGARSVFWALLTYLTFAVFGAFFAFGLACPDKIRGERGQRVEPSTRVWFLVIVGGGAALAGVLAVEQLRADLRRLLGFHASHRYVLRFSTSRRWILAPIDGAGPGVLRLVAMPADSNEQRDLLIRILLRTESGSSLRGGTIILSGTLPRDEGENGYEVLVSARCWPLTLELVAAEPSEVPFDVVIELDVWGRLAIPSLPSDFTSGDAGPRRI